VPPQTGNVPSHPQRAPVLRALARCSDIDREGIECPDVIGRLPPHPYPAPPHVRQFTCYDSDDADTYTCISRIAKENSIGREDSDAARTCPAVFFLVFFLC